MFLHDFCNEYICNKTCMCTNRVLPITEKLLIKLVVERKELIKHIYICR